MSRHPVSSYPARHDGDGRPADRGAPPTSVGSKRQARRRRARLRRHRQDVREGARHATRQDARQVARHSQPTTTPQPDARAATRPATPANDTPRDIVIERFGGPVRGPSTEELLQRFVGVRPTRRTHRRARAAVMAACGSRCAYCGAGLAAATMTLEHVEPLSLGGRNSLANFVSTCVACNKGKGAMTAAEFFDANPRAAATFLASAPHAAPDLRESARLAVIGPYADVEPALPHPPGPPSTVYVYSTAARSSHHAWRGRSPRRRSA